MRECTLGGALGQPLLDGPDRGAVERDGPLVVELAERHPQPCATRAIVHDAVDFEVEELAHPQPGVPEHSDADLGKEVIQLADRSHEGSVDVWWEAPGQDLGLARDVGREHEPARQGLQPNPTPRCRPRSCAG